MTPKSQTQGTVHRAPSRGGPGIRKGGSRPEGALDVHFAEEVDLEACLRACENVESVCTPVRHPGTLHSKPCTLHPTPYILHPPPYTLHPTPCTLHPAPSPQPLTSATAHSTLHPNPLPLQPKPSFSTERPSEYPLHPNPPT